MAWVYIHTCPNGMQYVGITSIQPEARWNGGHGYSGQRHMSQAINYFGWDNIDHVYFPVKDIDQAKRIESFLIRELDTYIHGLNGREEASYELFKGDATCEYIYQLMRSSEKSYGYYKRLLDLACKRLAVDRKRGNHRITEEEMSFSLFKTHFSMHVGMGNIGDFLGLEGEP